MDWIDSIEMDLVAVSELARAEAENSLDGSPGESALKVDSLGKWSKECGAAKVKTGRGGKSSPKRLQV